VHRAGRYRERSFSNPPVASQECDRKGAVCGGGVDSSRDGFADRFQHPILMRWLRKGITASVGQVTLTLSQRMPRLVDSASATSP